MWECVIMTKNTSLISGFNVSTGNFVWHANKGYMVLFGAISSIHSLIFLILLHRIDSERCHKVIDQLIRLKLSSIFLGRTVNEMKYRELWKLKDIGEDILDEKQEISPASDKDALKILKATVLLLKKEGDKYPSDEKIITEGKLTSAISFFWRPLIYLSAFIIFLLILVLVSLNIWGIIFYLLSAQNITLELLFNNIQMIQARIRLPLISLFSFVYLLFWNKRTKSSIREQMTLLTKICENTQEVEGIRGRIEQIIRKDRVGSLNLFLSKKELFFPYLTFEETNVTWNHDSFQIPISNYDHIYFVSVLLLLVPYNVLFRLLNFNVTIDYIGEIQIFPLDMLTVSWILRIIITIWGVIILYRFYKVYFTWYFNRVYPESREEDELEPRQNIRHFSFISMSTKGLYSRYVFSCFYLFSLLTSIIFYLILDFIAPFLTPLISLVESFLQRFFGRLIYRFIDMEVAEYRLIGDILFLQDTLIYYNFITFLLFLIYFISTIYNKSCLDKLLNQCLEEKEQDIIHSFSNLPMSDELHNKDHQLLKLQSMAQIVRRKKRIEYKVILDIAILLFSIFLPLFLPNLT